MITRRRNWKWASLSLIIGEQLGAQSEHSGTQAGVGEVTRTTSVPVSIAIESAAKQAGSQLATYQLYHYRGDN